MRCHLNFEATYACRGDRGENVEMASERFRVESMVRGYHVVREAAVGDKLSCERELGNHLYPFADWVKIAE